MNELLLELFSEEMPAKIIENVSGQLASLVGKSIAEKLRREVIAPEVYFTPVRIVIYFKDLPESDTNEFDEIRGPRVEAPKSAVLGFMKKYHITHHIDLEIRNGFYFYHLPCQQKSLNTLIQESVEEALNSVTWPKSMRWGNYDIKFNTYQHSQEYLFNAGTF